MAAAYLVAACLLFVDGAMNNLTTPGSLYRLYIHHQSS